MSAAAAIAPIVVAAIRDGLTGWLPGHDAAFTVLRARNVFSAHPPLVGMWSVASKWSFLELHFPGPWELYYLSVPVHLLGNRWGTLLAMALFNSVCVLGCGWLVHRRLGWRATVVTFGFLTLLVWTLGSENLIDPVPVQTIILPFALFLFAVWAVADGDLVSILVLSVVANFLVLNHLVLTLLVPVIGLCAVVGLVMTLRRRRRSDPDGWPSLRRSTLQSLALALALSVLMWVPPIIDELKHHPGNLSNLWFAERHGLAGVLGWGQALNSLVSILARPPYWFRDSYLSPNFGNAGTDATTIVLGLVAGAVLIGAVVLTVWRKRWTLVKALGIVAVAVGAALWNLKRSPGSRGFNPSYHHSLWCIAMFTWCVVALCYLSELVRHWRRRPTWPFAAGTVLVALLALPHANYGAATSDNSWLVSHDLGALAVHRLVGEKMVRVEQWPLGGHENNWSGATYEYTPNLLLALGTAGIPYCVSQDLAQLYGHDHLCPPGPLTLVAVTDRPGHYPNGTTVLGSISKLSRSEQSELRRLRAEVARWVRSRGQIELAPSYKKIVQALSPGRPAMLEAQMPNLDNHVLQELIRRHSSNESGMVVVPIETPGISAKDLFRWAELEHRRRDAVRLLEVNGYRG